MYEVVYISRSKDRIIDRAGNLCQIGQEFRDLDRCRIGDINHIFVPHPETLREEKPSWVAHVQVVNDWYDRTLEL